MSINHKLKQALTLSFFDKYVGYILRFISTIIIARLIAPEQIGIFSVAFTLITVGHALRDFGVAQYIIKEKVIDHQKICAAFTVMLMISWTLFTLIFLMKNQISDYFRSQEVKQAVTILSAIFILAPFGTIRIALLRREMNFLALAKINIISYLVLHASTLYLAYSGVGFMALVWGQVFGVVATNIAVLFYCKIPLLIPCIQGTRSVLKFGSYISLSNLADVIGQGAPDFILGRSLNMTAVGFFSRAQGLINLFKVFIQAAVWPVVLPYFSNRQHEGHQLDRDYYHTISLYTVVAFPFYIGMAVFNETVIECLFGSAWLPAAPLVKWLSMGGLCEACLPFMAPFLVAQGYEKVNLYLQLFTFCCLCIGISLGAYFSLQYAVMGYAIALILALIGKVVILQYYQLIKLSLIIRSIENSVKISLWLFLLCIVFVNVPINSLLIRTLIYSVVPLLLWCTLMIVIQHPLYLHFKNIIDQKRFA